MCRRWSYRDRHSGKRKSYDVARLAAGAAVDAVRQVVQGDDRNAPCLVRPPGHHALIDSPMGFCLFNNIAVAAAVATRELELERVMVVDWDVHHGNGTQAMFWEDPQVAFLSIHRWPFYPGTGWKDETGTGDVWAARSTYRSRWECRAGITFAASETSWKNSLCAFRPQLVLVSSRLRQPCRGSGRLAGTRDRGLRAAFGRRARRCRYVCRRAPGQCLGGGL